MNAVIERIKKYITYHVCEIPGAKPPKVFQPLERFCLSQALGKLKHWRMLDFFMSSIRGVIDHVGFNFPNQWSPVLIKSIFPLRNKNLFSPFFKVVYTNLSKLIRQMEASRKIV